MQIEIDVEKIVTRSIIDGILNSDRLQEEIDTILESDECQNIIKEHVQARLKEILRSEQGKKSIDSSLIDRIVDSDQIQEDTEEILEGDEYQKTLNERVKSCLNEALYSEEGKEQILCKIKDYLDKYDFEYDDELNEELSKGFSDVLISMMKESFERIKGSFERIKGG